MKLRPFVLPVFPAVVVLAALLTAVSSERTRAQHPARITWLQCSSALPDEGERYRYGPEQAFDGDPRLSLIHI